MTLNNDLSKDPFFVEMWELAEKSAIKYVNAKYESEGYYIKYKSEYIAKFKADFDAMKAKMNAKFQADFDTQKAGMDAQIKANFDAKNTEPNAFTKNHVLAIENVIKLNMFSPKEIADLLVVPLAFVLDVQAKMSAATPKKIGKKS